MPSNFVRVLDKLLAHKPHERYATAAEAAEALQNLIRPKTRPAVARPPASAAPPGRASRRCSNLRAELESPPALPPPSSSRSGPTIPCWFEPAARFAERRPKSALASLDRARLAMTSGPASCSGGF